MARLIFMGTPEFAVPTLEALIAHHDVAAVVTQPDRRGGRGRRELIPPPVKEVARQHHIPVLQPRTLRDAQMVDQLQNYEPEVIIVAAYGQILRRNVLELAPYGCVNVHASLLPKYRGAAPIAAAILNGEPEAGVTIMMVERKLDAGDILSQRAIPIAPDDTAGTLAAKLAELGADLLIETLPRYLAGEIEPQPQDEAQATYFPQIDKADGCIDWTRPAIEIERMIRAFDPWPGVYTQCDDRRLKILGGRALPDWQGPQAPGQVFETEDGTAVATGEGALLLDDVQPAGKRAMTCEAFACGQQDFVGTTLGDE